MTLLEFQKEIYILDGGLATELERRGFSLQNDPLWSASLLYKNPEVITKVHESYLNSGADIILTASYQASIEGFEKHLGLTSKESMNLIMLSVQLANEARSKFGNISKSGKKILVAGSVGSYGASLADGSEYSGSYSVTQKELISWHRPRIQFLLDAGVDLLAFETIPALKEAEALIKLLNEFPNAKAWLSFSCQSPHTTAHGDDIRNAAESCIQLTSPEKLVAIGVNCCSPENAVSLLQDVNAVLPEYPLIVYPNSGELWDTHQGWKGDKVKFNQIFLENWINSNVKIVGGCCRTTPEDISEIYHYLQSKKTE